MNNVQEKLRDQLNRKAQFAQGLPRAQFSELDIHSFLKEAWNELDTIPPYERYPNLENYYKSRNNLDFALKAAALELKNN